MRALLPLVVLWVGCAARPSPAPASAGHEIVRSMRDADLVLAIDRGGTGTLHVRTADASFAVPCDRLEGAWGLWLDDVDGDGRAEALVALHKPAHFDPAPHHRLHVYAFDHGRCVPLWRGTRLAGRFDAIAVTRDRPGTLVAHEWLSPTRRRIVRYRWADFGYRVDEVLWAGEHTSPPDVLYDDLDPAPPGLPP